MRAAVDVDPLIVARNSKSVKHRPGDVLDRELIIDRVSRDLVGGSDDVAAANSASSEHRGHHRAPVVSAGVLVDFWRSPEFAADDHQRAVKKAAFLQVVEQCGEASVEVRKQVSFQVHKVAAMCVPGRVLAKVDLDKSHTRFDEASPHQHRETEFVSSVTLDSFRIGVFNVERRSCLRISENGDRLQSLLIQFRQFGGLLQSLLLPLDLAEQSDAAVKTELTSLGKSQHWSVKDRLGHMIECVLVKSKTVRARSVAERAFRGDIHVPRFPHCPESPCILARPESRSLVDARFREDD